MAAARPLKIGFVFDDSLDKGDGIQQYMFCLSAYYEAQGHEVHYLVGETRRTDIPHVHSLSRNVKVQFNGNRMTIPLWGDGRRIRKLLAAEQFDVLHVQVPYHPLMAGRIIRAAGPTTVIFGTFHVAPYSAFVTVTTQLLGLWSRPSLRCFDEMVSVSTAAQAFARQTFRIESAIVPNVVDRGRFLPHTARPAGRPLRVVFLGRLVPRKGCKTLLEAVALLQKRGTKLPDFEVVIGGRGPLQTELEKYAAEQNLQNVRFDGFITEEDKPGFLQAADVAVFPSSAGESFGIVLIEAMAAGAAVLAGDNPGYRSVMLPQPELLFAATDAQLLADKLAGLLTHTTRRRAMQGWGEQYTKQFDVAVVGERLLQGYQERLALRKRRGVR